MNPQYIQQQQTQQQPGYYPGPPTSSPYGELNSNVPSNPLNGPPMNSQYMSQKPMQGPPTTNLHQPSAPYYMNHIQPHGNSQYESSTNNPHNVMPSPTSQNNIVNQMSNMCLGDPQRPPSTNFPPPPLPGKSSPTVSTPSNVNGFNNALDASLPGSGPIGQTDPGEKTAPPISGQDLQQTSSENLSTHQSGLPFSEHSTGSNPGKYYPGQNVSSEQGFNTGLSTQTAQRNITDTPSGQPNFPRPPTTGQKSTGPPLPGQQNLSNLPLQGQPNLSNSPLPGQQNLSGPLMSGPPNFSGPPLPSQQSQSNTATQGVHGQQNLPGLPPLPKQTLSGAPPLSKQNLSGPPLPGQSNISGPPLPGPPLPGHPSMQAQQRPNQSYLEQSNMPMSNLHGQSNLSGPPLMGQQNILPPPMSGQQNIAPPPLPGQQNIAPPPLPGQQNFNRQPFLGQQNLSGPQVPPPLPGQAMGQMMNPPSNLPQSTQRQYASNPPMQGQGIGNPLGHNRSPPGTMPGYQPAGYHGYSNDMYNAQRGSYQGGAPGAAGGYQPGIQPQQARRLDPDQMPSPIQVIEDDQDVRGGVFITNQKGLVPPLVTTRFVTQDQGNASPRYIRSTMYTVPTTADIIKQTSVPFALIVSPMARIAENEYEPPIVDMGEIGPVRCVRCKAYMSPFMQFIDAGRRFQCMFCKATTEVPAEYFQHLDHTGQRMDRYERPELMLGTYEYIATKDYCRNNHFPKPPAIVFVLDVSYNTVKSGLVNLLCMKMKSILRNLPVDVGQSKTNIKVGFITYNNTVHFYNVNSCLAQPQMMVVGDIQDVFMPLLGGFLCDVEESEAVIDCLMTQIPAMFADTRETETILAPAIQAGLEALKASDCAGKLMVFHSSLPIAEAPGKLRNRDDRKVLGTEKEKTVLAPQNNVYNNLGQECVGAGCSVDLFVFNNSYVDIATIGQVARLTGGEVYKYTYFQADIDGDRLVSDVINDISRPIAFDAIMRVRTSTGVRATDFFGHFFMSNTTDMELASIDCNKAIAVEVKHDDKLTDDEGVYIQAALLYTSCSGIRRLRIINLSLKTSSQIAELYRACDLDAIINYFSKQSVFKLIESSPKAVKDSLVARCANILAAYRKHCASPSNAGQLILPECMKLLPLYINSLLKSDALSGGADMTIDDRSFVMQTVAIMPISISVVYTYPRLLPLHDVDPQDTELPQMLRCSIDKFTDYGAYLLENSIHMFLWLGLGLSPQWVQAVFGVPSVAQVDTDHTALPILDTPMNKLITDIIDRVRMERHRCMRLTIVRQREKMETVLRHFLIEDRGNDGSPSYVDFLCHMHKEIRALLSQ
ncbi:PREDICTED: protein transport protein Sec24C [Dufourea novaeangliae]|uniref:Protein transport protein Sec24C n=1 Tax=Dufourea novaeangliae TaxID=178035 RepID=A0A154PFW8_DUFNO|nr:PREDICTED: protein transport protein Sec24C [Dufourea novaeangliae]XP_015432681.1 PREDICTED: protein transport protein Sec24C [Dufourea novaeangliae]KZC10745.1 Protein transport protein Sec24C [Dufourea novaeangliae]